MQIAIKQLSKRFNATWIFKNIQYTFEENKSYAIIGYNGSGKSTLMQILYNYNTFSGGQIEYTIDQQIVSDNPQQYMAFAAPYLDLPEDLTLKELVQFYFSIKTKRDTIDLEQLMTSAKLIPHQNKQIKNYSSGMKQRVKLILAFATQAHLLLLDEPCSNFDEEGIKWYQQCIDLLQNKCTIIVASNQPYEYTFCQDTLNLAS